MCIEYQSSFQYAAGVFVAFTCGVGDSKDEIKTERVTNTLEPNFNFEKTITIAKVTPAILKQLQETPLSLFVCCCVARDE